MGNRDLERSLSDYQEIYGRPTPIRYDILKFSDEHRKLDALLRRYYDYLHPLVKDLFTSFALEFTLLLEEMEKIKMEKSSLIADIEERRLKLEEETDERIVEIKNKTEELRSKLNGVDEQEEQYENKISELEQEIKEKDALIITQRRQLDLLIEKTAKIEKSHDEQQEKITQSIDQVSTFTSELGRIEEDMRKLEAARLTLEEENKNLKDMLSKSDKHVELQISEISELYNELKTEYEEVTKALVAEKENNKKLSKLLENKNHEVSELSERLQLLKKDVETYGTESEISNIETQNLIAELEDLRKKNEVFSRIAHKLLDLRDKLDKQEVKIVSQGKKPEEYAKQAGISVKKWSPSKKSALELELEREIGFDKSLEMSMKELAVKPKDPPQFSKITLEEKEEHPQDVISKIDKKIRKPSSKDPVIRTMKTSEPATNELDKALESNEADFPKFDLTGIEEEIENIEETKEKTQKSEPEIKPAQEQKDSKDPKISNFEKMLNHIETEDVDFLMDFAHSLPSPPENPPQRKQKIGEEDEDNQEPELLPG